MHTDATEPLMPCVLDVAWLPPIMMFMPNSSNIVAAALGPAAAVVLRRHCLYGIQHQSSTKPGSPAGGHQSMQGVPIETLRHALRIDGEVSEEPEESEAVESCCCAVCTTVHTAPLPAATELSRRPCAVSAMSEIVIFSDYGQRRTQPIAALKSRTQ
jgi:hypothetical protein